jgi:chromosome segregation ATPase
MPSYSTLDPAHPLPDSPREAIRVLSERLKGLAARPEPSGPAHTGPSLDQADLTRVLSLVRHASQALQQLDERRREAEERLAGLSERAAAELRDMDARLLSAESRARDAEARARVAEERARAAEAQVQAAEADAAEARAWLAKFREAITDAFAGHEARD